MCQLMTSMLLMPNETVRHEVIDTATKYMLQSRTTFHRIQFIDLLVLAGQKMSRALFQSLFAKLIVLLEKERIKQVVIYLAKHAVQLSTFFDFEVVTNMGQQFKQKKGGSVIEAILTVLQKRFER
jgi:hypothetical protein